MKQAWFVSHGQHDGHAGRRAATDTDQSEPSDDCDKEPSDDCDKQVEFQSTTF